MQKAYWMGLQQKEAQYLSAVLKAETAVRNLHLVMVTKKFRTIVSIKKSQIQNQIDDMHISFSFYLTNIRTYYDQKQNDK